MVALLAVALSDGFETTEAASLAMLLSTLWRLVEGTTPFVVKVEWKTSVAAILFDRSSAFVECRQSRVCTYN
jgi:hypothetical protein